MPYVPISKTTVTYDTVTSNARDFSVIAILGQHNYFLERIKFYGSVSEASQDLPIESKEYKAVAAAFSANQGLKTIAVGRRRCSSTVLPTTATVGTVYKFTITHSGGSSLIQVTSVGGDTLTTIGGKIVTAITAIGALTTVVTPSNSAGLVTLAQASGTAEFKISGFENITPGFVASAEPVATTIGLMEAENRNFYHINTTDRTQTHIEALASFVASSNNYYTMSYATAITDVYSGNISPTPAVGDFPATIKLAGNKRVINACYVQSSELDLFPETRVFASRANKQPGTVIYSNITELGIQPGKTASGLLLTEGEKSNIASRGLSYFDYSKGGVVVYRRGFSQGAGSSAWSDDVVIGDFFRARCDEAVETRFFQTNSAKISGRESGYVAISNIIQSVGDAMTSSGAEVRAFKEGSFKVQLPTPEEIQANVAGRIGKFKVTAILEGAMDSAEIDLSLSY